MILVRRASESGRNRLGIYGYDVRVFGGQYHNCRFLHHTANEEDGDDARKGSSNRGISRNKWSDNATSYGSGSIFDGRVFSAFILQYSEACVCASANGIYRIACDRAF
ncbi:hypothetical protein ANAPH1_01031 [Anaplasma phagocytophilum]|nr:hypothetical protein ANAPH1_01031 [Anaplasma phagocytophilum]